jgi:Cu2+-containing amine oxidase
MKSSMSDLTRRMQKVVAALSRKEEKQAVKVVTALMQERYPTGSEAHFRVFPPVLAIEKPPRRESIPQRLIRVFVADYGRKQNLEFVLDRNTELVKTAEYQGFQPALLDEEIAEADKIVRKDAQVSRLVKRRGVFLSAFTPESESKGASRVAGLRYVLAKRAGQFEMLVKVVVDLSERRVSSIDQTAKG